uniref:Uncharacterized protein n=1 Tax=viral metagenome TaxID=1070528 RepID=A0A6C0L7L3_9ZZZZ
MGCGLWFWGWGWVSFARSRGGFNFLKGEEADSLEEDGSVEDSCSLLALASWLLALGSWQLQ